MNERAPGSASGAVACGLAFSVLAALPALVRVLPTGVSAVGAAVGLVGAASLIIVPVGLWVRRAIEAGFPAADRALLAGAALSALPLALFGGVLKSTTHHRPLGGATFAVAASCLLALCVGVSFRFLGRSGGNAVKSPWRTLFTLGCGLSLCGTLLLATAGAARGSLVDFLALSVAGAAAGSQKLPARLERFRLGPILLVWLVLLICAGLTLRSPQLVGALTTRAPVCFAALSWLGDGS